MLFWQNGTEGQVTVMGRLIDADSLEMYIEREFDGVTGYDVTPSRAVADFMDMIYAQPTVDAEPVKHGRWVLTPHKESCNYRWNVTAHCSECKYDAGEIWAGFFPGVPDGIAKIVAEDCAKSAKPSNYCPNCGAKMG